MTGLGQAEFAQRRRQLMDAMEPGSIALVPGAVMQRRNRDIDYAFRQDSDLLYLKENEIQLQLSHEYTIRFRIQSLPTCLDLPRLA